MITIKPHIQIIAFCAIIISSCTSNESKEEIQETVESYSVMPILEGQPNFRDLGGYETIDGNTVKKGLIYRTGELSHITDTDVQKLDSMHISVVINFLTPEEIEMKGEDILPEDTKIISLPLNSGNMAMEVQQAAKSGNFDNIPPDQNAQFHAILTEEMEEEYGLFLKELSKVEAPTAFHCSHGVHRTGTASAIFLSVLGVPWETVREEYLLTNEYRKEETELVIEKTRALVAQKKDIEPSEVDMTNINAFYILEGSYIDATRDYVIENYGSFENYAVEGLGMTDEELLALKEKYLE